MFSEMTCHSSLNHWFNSDINGDLMVINGDLMVINPLAMEYKWLGGGLEHGFYDFPFSWEWNVIIPTDELHDFSEG